MAVQLESPVGNTGFTGDHWAPSDFRIISAENVPAGVTRVMGTYRMWASAAARAKGKTPSTRSSRIVVDVPSADPKLSEIEAAMDKALTKLSVKGKPAVMAVAARAVVKAVLPSPAVDADLENGIVARPAIKEIKARKAIKAVKAQAAVAAVSGGQLESGTIV